MPAKNSFTTSGILLVDKRPGITSHDAVAITRRAAGTRKVGHAGTLDPMATGLLVLGLNSATRLLTYVVGLDKEYLATIRLGVATTTDDREGEPLERADAALVREVTPERVAAGIALLTGAIEQVPSSVSAIKVDGQRAYARARAGETVELKPRPVTVSVFEVLADRLVVEAEEREGEERAEEREGEEHASAAAFLDLDVRVVCSSGTYIRALARDLGSFLGTGGHLTALRRTRIGPFDVTDAASLDDLDVAAALQPPADAAAALFPVLHLDDAQAVDLSNGKRIPLSDELASAAASAPVAAIAPDGRLIGLVEIVAGRARSLVNFPPDERMPA
jgi:tRNA pseudouridine55 synthase